MVRTLILLLCLAGGVLAEPLTFNFSPPDSISYITAAVSVRYRELDGTQSRVDTTTVISRDRLMRTTDGYRVISNIESMTGSRENDAATSLMNGAFMSTEFVMLLDSTGQAVSLDGFDAVDAYLKAHADSAYYSLLHQNLSFDALAEKELNTWNSRLDRLLARPLQPGEMYLEEVDIALPNMGEFSMYAVTHFVDTLRVDGVLLGKVLVIQNTNLDELADRIGLTSEQMIQDFGFSDSTFIRNRREVSAKKGGLMTASAMVFDLKTMLWVSETTEIVVTMNITDPSGVSKTAKMTDLKTKTVEYLK